MTEHEHKRFSPENLKKLDAPERVLMQPTSQVLEALKLDGDTRTVDLGVGTGYYALPVARIILEAGGEGRVLGLDVSEEMLQETEKRAKERGVGNEISFIKVTGDGDLPLDDDSFDRALVANTAHELDSRPKVWSEFKRALRKGGFILIVDWSPDGPFEIGPPKHHRLSESVLEKELQEAGFNTEKLRLYDNFYTIKASVQ